MTGKQREQAERQVLERVLEGIRSTTRKEWLEQLAEYERGTEGMLIDPKQLRGPLSISRNGHKPHKQPIPAAATERLAD